MMLARTTLALCGCVGMNYNGLCESQKGWGWWQAMNQVTHSSFRGLEQSGLDEDYARIKTILHTYFNLPEPSILTILPLSLAL